MANKIQIAKYAGILAICFALGIFAGFNPLAVRVDQYAYDRMLYGMRDTWTPQSAVVAIDEATLEAGHGMRGIRTILAQTLDQLALAQPKAVALDVTLHDQVDPAEDARLEASLRVTRNLILPCQLAGTTWEDPAPRFRTLGALGHVHTEGDRLDGVSRQIILERVADGQRRWALSLEALRVTLGAGNPEESPVDVAVGNILIPAPRKDGRSLRIRYLLPGTIPTISALEIGRHRDELRGKTVFLGVTALSAANDRLVNPYGVNFPGVEMHAQAFETMAHGQFLVPATNTTTLAVCGSLALAAGLSFWFLTGWRAYVLIVPILAAAHYFLPVQFFARGIVLPYVAPVAVAWLSSIGAATYRHFVVRRQLRKSESEKSRYQQAIHWAAHEMRTPLTAIQGSSELMTRYSLPDQKRNELSNMINSESKRLARIISTFLDVERLAEGQMELKREPLAATGLVDTCMRRVTPLAERKHIGMFLDSNVEGTLLGDRELLEYALYNLLTNAVKYSPADTEIHVYSELRGGELHLAVRDQGIGMDAKEIKRIFHKFYRTKRAEASGETGTGIGLSIVEQIVFQHGGRIEVTSTPGKGSCFTMIMKAHVSAPTDAETADRRR
ncbi:MAG: integral rane sensor signal transduction histidine kinase [Bryobacterales bacterium]|nr:integral rane sensor signal transduction histidine kinase [Bryobacterales bacterium]